MYFWVILSIIFDLILQESIEPTSKKRKKLQNCCLIYFRYSISRVPKDLDRSKMLINIFFNTVFKRGSHNWIQRLCKIINLEILGVWWWFSCLSLKHLLSIWMLLVKYSSFVTFSSPRNLIFTRSFIYFTFFSTLFDIIKFVMFFRICSWAKELKNNSKTLFKGWKYTLLINTKKVVKININLQL